MDQKQNITQFIKNVSKEDYAKANSYLAAVVNEKLKARIITANQKLSNKK
jgi:hypothetical protein